MLDELPDHLLIVAFEIMDMLSEGWKMLRGDYIANCDNGVSIPDALASIANWPREPSLWITLFLRDPDALTL